MVSRASYWNSVFEDYFSRFPVSYDKGDMHRCIEKRMSLEEELTSLRSKRQRKARDREKILLRELDVLRKDVIAHNTSLVFMMLRKCYSPPMSSVYLESLIDEGMDTLDDAWRCFKCDKGFEFSTYACKSIFYRMDRARVKYYRGKQHMTVSLDSLTVTDGTYYALVSDDSNGVDFFLQMKEVLSTTFNGKSVLDEREKEVLKLRYGFGCEELTLEEVGGRLGVTRERVRQIQNAALGKVRDYLENAI
ncbi:MAG TPA: sigma-70 family RNA polymerase sigma factor [Candidatus Nanoarchaeia archaeon]|nr:sigma-70 family RNA polymerase sigma factor [Candidatus Nanoarchaeia archaeon]